MVTSSPHGIVLAATTEKSTWPLFRISNGCYGSQNELLSQACHCLVHRCLELLFPNGLHISPAELLVYNEQPDPQLHQISPLQGAFLSVTQSSGLELPHH